MGLARGRRRWPIANCTYGVFNNDLPKLLVVGESLREQARSMLVLSVLAWARGRNGRLAWKQNSPGHSTPAELSSGQPAALSTSAAPLAQYKSWLGPPTPVVAILASSMPSLSRTGAWPAADECCLTGAGPGIFGW